LGLFLVFALGCYSGRAADCDSTNYIAKAENLIRALYPALDGGLTVNITAANLWFQREPPNEFVIGLCQPPGAREHGCPFSGTFSFDVESTYLINMDMSEGATTGPWEKLAKTVDEHPEWTEADIGKALKEAGGRYGPERRREFVTSLPSSALAPYLGGLTIESVEFWGRDPNGVRKTLTWRVVATARRRDRSAVKYIFTFEPLKGNLLSVWQDW
jgi:hypothetical protein